MLSEENLLNEIEELSDKIKELNQEIINLKKFNIQLEVMSTDEVAKLHKAILNSYHAQHLDKF